jgi:hypothetical protein
MRDGRLEGVEAVIERQQRTTWLTGRTTASTTTSPTPEAGSGGAGNLSGAVVGDGWRSAFSRRRPSVLPPRPHGSGGKDVRPVRPDFRVADPPPRNLVAEALWSISPHLGCAMIFTAAVNLLFLSSSLLAAVHDADLRAGAELAQRRDAGVAVGGAGAGAAGHGCRRRGSGPAPGARRRAGRRRPRRTRRPGVPRRGQGRDRHGSGRRRGGTEASGRWRGGDADGCSLHAALPLRAVSPPPDARARRQLRRRRDPDDGRVGAAGGSAARTADRRRQPDDRAPGRRAGL